MVNNQDQLDRVIVEDSNNFKLKSHSNHQLLAIHNRPGSFSDIWIEYCKGNNIPYKIVNCYDSEIIRQLDGCAGLMWHWDLNVFKAPLFARQLTLSLEKKGIQIFPDVNTSWHYDDKVGQKYLLEAIGAPLIKSYVFYSKKDAIKWLKETSFPKVFKLRSGAGSTNVQLVNTYHEARHLINKAFGSGFPQVDPVNRLKERFWLLRRDKNLLAVKKVITGIVRLVVNKKDEKFLQREKGYIYFQEFLPNNDHDIRLVVVGDKCFSIVRYCREGDFRASGSGLKDYSHQLIDPKCVKIAFETAEKLNVQSVAFDFIFDGSEFKIIEMSYAFISQSFPGYWDKNLKWHEGNISPQVVMIENFIESLKVVKPARS